MTESAEEKSGATRTRLIDSAVRAFASKGFHATTTRDITAGAGISPATLYFHHKSKEDLLFLIALSGHREIYELIVNAATICESPRCQLIAFTREFIANHADRNMLARVINYELGALSTEHLHEIKEIRKETERRLRAIVLAGNTAGEFFVNDVRVETIAILSLGIDVARWYRKDGPWTPEELAAHYVNIALRIVGSEPVTHDCTHTELQSEKLYT